jgi:UDP-N-acetylglucosamine acyltransferase
LNKIGLRRGGVRGDRYAALEEAFRALRAGKHLPDSPNTEEIEFLREWLSARSKRGTAGFIRDSGPADELL